MWRLLQLLLLSLFCVCGAGTCADDNCAAAEGSYASIVEELRRFAAVHIEGAIAEFNANMESRLGSEQACFSTVSGKVYRQGCCVLYSNVAYVLLTEHFGLDSDGETIINYDSNDPAILRDRATRLVERFYEVVSGGKGGEYVTVVEVQGVLFKLLKCELDTVHTYLLLIPLDANQARKRSIHRIIIDLSVSQFYFIPDLLEPEDYRTAADLQLETESDMWFIGDAEEALKTVAKEDRIRQNMAKLRPDADDTFWEEFDKLYELMRSVYSQRLQDNYCGRAVQSKKPAKSEL